MKQGKNTKRLQFAKRVSFSPAIRNRSFGKGNNAINEELAERSVVSHSDENRNDGSSQRHGGTTHGPYSTPARNVLENDNQKSLSSPKRSRSFKRSSRANNSERMERSVLSQADRRDRDSQRNTELGAEGVTSSSDKATVNVLDSDNLVSSFLPATRNRGSEKSRGNSSERSERSKVSHSEDIKDRSAQLNYDRGAGEVTKYQGTPSSNMLANANHDSRTLSKRIRSFKKSSGAHKPTTEYDADGKVDRHDTPSNNPLDTETGHEMNTLANRFPETSQANIVSTTPYLSNLKHQVAELQARIETLDPEKDTDKIKGYENDIATLRGFILACVAQRTIATDNKEVGNSTLSKSLRADQEKIEQRFREIQNQRKLAATARKNKIARQPIIPENTPAIQVEVAGLTAPPCTNRDAAHGVSALRKAKTTPLRVLVARQQREAAARQAAEMARQATDESAAQQAAEAASLSSADHTSSMVLPSWTLAEFLPEFMFPGLPLPSCGGTPPAQGSSSNLPRAVVVPGYDEHSAHVPEQKEEIASKSVVSQSNEESDVDSENATTYTHAHMTAAEATTTVARPADVPFTHGGSRSATSDNTGSTVGDNVSTQLICEVTVKTGDTSTCVDTEIASTASSTMEEEDEEGSDSSEGSSASETSSSEESDLDTIFSSSTAQHGHGKRNWVKFSLSGTWRKWRHQTSRLECKSDKSRSSRSSGSGVDELTEVAEGIEESTSDVEEETYTYYEGEEEDTEVGDETVDEEETTVADLTTYVEMPSEDEDDGEEWTIASTTQDEGTLHDAKQKQESYYAKAKEDLLRKQEIASAALGSTMRNLEHSSKELKRGIEDKTNNFGEKIRELKEKAEDYDWFGEKSGYPSIFSFGSLESLHSR